VLVRDVGLVAYLRVSGVVVSVSGGKFDAEISRTEFREYWDAYKKSGLKRFQSEIIKIMKEVKYASTI